MRKPEQLLYDALRRNKPEDALIERIENQLTEALPDVYIRFRRGHAVWVELKATRLPKRASTPLLRATDFRTGQEAWHKQHWAMEHESWILVRDDKLQLYLAPGNEACALYIANSARINTLYGHGRNWEMVWDIMAGAD
jgi:hypothetical protein